MGARSREENLREGRGRTKRSASGVCYELLPCDRARFSSIGYSWAVGDIHDNPYEVVLVERIHVMPVAFHLLRLVTGRTEMLHNLELPPRRSSPGTSRPSLNRRGSSTSNRHHLLLIRRLLTVKGMFWSRRFSRLPRARGVGQNQDAPRKAAQQKG